MAALKFSTSVASPPLAHPDGLLVPAAGLEQEVCVRQALWLLTTPRFTPPALVMVLISMFRVAAVLRELASSRVVAKLAEGLVAALVSTQMALLAAVANFSLSTLYAGLVKEVCVRKVLCWRTSPLLAPPTLVMVLISMFRVAAVLLETASSRVVAKLTVVVVAALASKRMALLLAAIASFPLSTLYTRAVRPSSGLSSVEAALVLALLLVSIAALPLVQVAIGRFKVVLLESGPSSLKEALAMVVLPTALLEQVARLTAVVACFQLLW